MASVSVYKFVVLQFLVFFLTLDSSGEAKSSLPSICPKITSRKRWGALAAKNVEYQIFPIETVIIHHTVTPRCNSKLKCSNALLNMQNYNKNELNSDDIAYNFLIGDTAVYEGTGWHVRGSHTLNYNSNSTGIAFIGDFSEQMPTEVALQLAKDLIQCGVELGEIDTNYILFGGRQLISTESPGLELYGDLQDWEHWTSSP